MIKITRNQRDYLEQNGCVFGRDLHRTYSKNKRYYATENNRVMTLFEKYKEETTIKN